jgi:hypothetical protein
MTTHRKDEICEILYQGAKEVGNDPEALSADPEFVKSFVGISCPKIERGDYEAQSIGQLAVDHVYQVVLRATRLRDNTNLKAIYFEDVQRLTGYRYTVGQLREALLTLKVEGKLPDKVRI